MKEDEMAEKETGMDIPKNEKRVEFSDSLEREAMNRIWKAIPPASRKKHYSDFDIVCRSLKSGNLTSLERTFEDEDLEISEETLNIQYKYLTFLSEGTRKFILKAINVYHINLYHSVMAIINSRPEFDEEQIRDRYYAKYKNSRPYIADNQEEMDELIHYCYNKMTNGKQ